MMGSFLKPFYFWLQRYFSKPPSLVIFNLFYHADQLRFPPRQPYEFWLGSLCRTVRSGVNQSSGFVKGAGRAWRARPSPAKPSSAQPSSHRRRPLGASQKLRVKSSLVSSVIFVAPANTPKRTELGLWGLLCQEFVFGSSAVKDWKTAQLPMAKVKEMCWVQQLPTCSDILFYL